MQTIAVANHKGGTGKTATAHALGEALARGTESARGRRVLLVDTDPQNSLTGACGIRDAAGQSLAEVLGGAKPGTVEAAAAIRPLGERLSILPADIALARTELGLVSRLGRESVLKRTLATVGRDFDVCIIDCPPSLSILTVNALAAAQGAIVPTQPQAADLRGLGLFLETISQVREALNPELALLGVLLTFCEGRLVHHQEAIELMAKAGLPLMTTRIGRSVRVAEAAGMGQSVVTYEPGNPRAAEYGALAAEVATWLDGTR